MEIVQHLRGLGAYEAAEKIIDLRIERDDFEMDALRYRWLRDNANRIKWDRGLTVDGTGYLGYSFDEAVDMGMVEDQE